MKINEITDVDPQALDPKRVEYFVNDVKKGVASKKRKNNTSQNFGSYKFVPVTGLPDGFYLAYKKSPDQWSKISSDKFMVTLIDVRNNINKPEVVSYIWFNPENLYFGPPNYSSMTGLKVSSVGTAQKYRGKGYTLQVYKMLVNHGQILFSDTSQTPDGSKLWEKLITSGEFSAWGLLINASSTLELKKAVGPIDNSNVYQILDLVFSNEANQLVLVPKSDKQTIDLLMSKRNAYI